MNVRTTYQEKADAQLREWREWIDNYKKDPAVVSGVKRGSSLSGESRESWQQIVERLEDSHRIARSRLEELRAAQNDTWELAKQAVERAMIDLKKVLDESGAGQEGRLLHLQTSRVHQYEPFSKRG